jgi:hypothetical protein
VFTEDKPGSPEDIVETLAHFGVLGMRWGHHGARASAISHPAIAHIPKSTRINAHKDAEEFTRAKLFFGQGAGTRRKLIKATVESKRRKDPLYGHAFDHFVKQTDLGQRAVQARRERKRKDTTGYAKKTIKGVGHVLRGNNQYANATASLLVPAAVAYARYHPDQVRRVRNKGLQIVEQLLH